jgi:uncharacterized protein
MQKSSPALTGILVKPASADCNLRCRYCFYLATRELYPEGRRRMTGEVLEALIRSAMVGGAGVVSFCWQGGEPTLMGRVFFERALELQRRFTRPGQTAANSLQTNGLLLDDDFCRFLAQHRFLVGLSIDGTKDLHDHYRLGTKGRPSYERVRASLERLLAHGVDTNALIMVTDQTADRVEEIWRTLVALGLHHLQFIPCLELDPADPSRLAEYSVDPKIYGQVLCQLFDLWVGDFSGGVPATFVRWFEALLFGYVGQPVPLCELRPTCGTELVVEHNGDVYSCDFFVAPEHRLGNVMRQDLLKMLGSEPQRCFGASKAQIHRDCRDCPWLSRCFGGCLKDRACDLSGQGRNPFCAAYRRFFEHADPTLKRLANDWQRRFGPR